jgi:phosphatidylglycerol---prolipoprotein diacylglyceryl transferase
MYPVLLTIGHWQVRSYAVVMVLVLVLGMAAMWHLARRAGFPSGEVALCAVGMALCGLLGGRLNAWLFHLGGRLVWPDLNLASFRGGSTGFGAVAGVLGFAALYGRWRRWNVGRLLDLAAPILPLGEAIQRVGCLLNGCCYGRETDSFLGVYLPAAGGRWAERYPTQVMTGIFCLGLAAWLWSRRRRTSFPGELALTYVVVYGAGRVALDALRGDEHVVLGALTSHQVAALVMAIAAGLVILYRQSRQAPAPAPAGAPPQTSGLEGGRT